MRCRKTCGFESHIRYFVKSRDIVRSMPRDFFVFKGRVCRLCGKHVRWFSLHSKFIFLEGCRVTSRSWAENVIKTNKKGVYPPTLFEGWWVNGFCAVSKADGVNYVLTQDTTSGTRLGQCSGFPFISPHRPRVANPWAVLESPRNHRIGYDPDLRDTPEPHL